MLRMAAVVPCTLRDVQVHLIDGTYELFRQWFGAPQAQHQGREVGAVRSMIRSFAMLLSRPPQVRPDGERDRLPMTHVGVAFDHVIESFATICSTATRPARACPRRCSPSSSSPSARPPPSG